jgi:hypothetical protein
MMQASICPLTCGQDNWRHQMRDLHTSELSFVSGGHGGCYTPPPPPPCGCPAPRAKGNNGFGNGGGDPAPGNSGTNGAPNAGQKLADVVR